MLTDTDVKQAVVDAAAGPLGITADNVTVERQDIDMIRGTSVEVSTTANYTSLTHFSIVDFLLNNKQLQSSATVRIE
jgi:hypothetical protein